MAARSTGRKRSARPLLRQDRSVRFYLMFVFTIVLLVAFEAFLTSLPFAEAIPDYAQDLQQR
jgi:hypothetical protein